MTVKEMALIIVLKTSMLGFTVIDMPSGASTRATYLEETAPTFVTVLIIVVEFLRVGMVMEGKFMFRIEDCFLGQNVGLPVTLEISEFL